MLVLSESDDVILLNSDTEVTSGWTRKLQAAAYSRPAVATVTPLTNNGVICSFPCFCMDNELPDGLTLDELSNLIARVSAREYPELPTAIGFCMYIRREVIDKIGGFDEEAFGKGYGEENDFCCRARNAGYVDILDDATFIYHKGNMSFKEARNELSKRNEIILRERHPDYYPRVSAFCAAFPLHFIHGRIRNEMINCWAKGRPQVLHILHNGPYRERRHSIGGTEFHVQDLISNVKGVCHWTLVPGIDCMFLSAHIDGVEHEIPLGRTTLPTHIMDPEVFDVVHLHHTIAYDASNLEEALLAHGNYVVSLHDYSLLCPRIFMMKPDTKHCDGFECVSACGYAASDVKAMRERGKRILEGARKVICFSESTKNYAEKVLKADAKFTVIPHGTSAEPQKLLALPAPNATEPLKVAFIGYLPLHKGAQLIAGLTKVKMLSNSVAVEWHVVGEVYQELDSSVILHGRYERDELSAKLRALEVHLVVIASLCPETYCLTLDEAWAAGVPVVVTPLGAPADRVAKSGGGWVSKACTEESIAEILNSITTDWELYRAAATRVGEIRLLTSEDEGARHRRIYRNFFGSNPKHPYALLHRLQPGLVKIPQKVGAVKQGVNKFFRELKRSGLRAPLQRGVKTIIPRPVLEALRSLR